MKKLLTILACTLGLGTVGAGVAQADYASNKARAFQAETNNCLRYTGCGAITLLGNINGGQDCSQWLFSFHTVYYGTLYNWVYVGTPHGNQPCLATVGPLAGSFYY